MRGYWTRGGVILGLFVLAQCASNAVGQEVMPEVLQSGQWYCVSKSPAMEIEELYLDGKDTEVREALDILAKNIEKGECDLALDSLGPGEPIKKLNEIIMCATQVTGGDVPPFTAYYPPMREMRNGKIEITC